MIEFWIFAFSYYIVSIRNLQTRKDCKKQIPALFFESGGITDWDGEIVTGDEERETDAEKVRRMVQ